MSGNTAFGRRATATAYIPPGGTVNLGTSLPVPFDGTQSFSLGVWVRIDDPAATTAVLSQSGAFQLGVQQGCPSFSMTGLLMGVTSPSVLPAGSHYIVVTYAASAPHTGQISLYVDNLLVAQASGSNLGARSTQPIVLGGSSQQYVWSLSLYNAALPASQVGCNWTPGAAAPNQVACYCFCDVPPKEMVANLPFSFQGGAAQKIEVPATYFTANAWVQPASQSPLALPTSAFTVQAWCNPVSGISLPMTVACAGTQDLNQAVAISLVPVSGTGYAVKAQCGGTFIQGGQVAAGSMGNIALTFDGSTLSLYLNGALITSQACAPAGAITGPTLVGIGAISTTPNFSNCFQGDIQTVDFWSQCLTPAQITQYMTEDPSAQAGCLASYQLFARPLDGVTQRAMVAVGSPQLRTSYLAPPTGMQTPQRLMTSASAQQPTLASAVALPTLAGKVTPGQIDAWVKDLEDFLSPYANHAGAATLAPELRTRLEALARGEHPAEGHLVFNRLEGTEWVFYHRHNGLTTVCLRLKASDTTTCGAWYISLILTLILGILAVFGVSLSSQRLSGAVVRWVNRYPNLVRAFADTLQGEVTARSLVVGLRALVVGDTFTSLLWDVAASMSWWELLFLGLSLALSFLEIIFPNPTTAVWASLKLGQLVVACAQLVVVLSEKPKDC
ncbi:LamG-like jellyroll fold domain-containing protein [Roseateles sp. L2-2]|uniref:LamG-like jellyroll fold domain-containing protein n=1 Tax=Roseateles sp. L2-2 TaxID=3422597 RepID=UPI003D35C33B